MDPEKNIISTAQLEDSADIQQKSINVGAKHATELEHQLTLWEAIKTHRTAVMWSVLVSTCIIMEGYDIVLINSFYAQPAFQKYYGVWLPDDQEYQIPAKWQLAIGNGTACGTIIGAFINGYITARYGYRVVLLSSLVALTAFIFIPFFAKNIQTILAGEFLCGIPFGVFAVAGPAYASEVCPLALRGTLTTFVNLCWGIGQLISAGVNERFSTVESEWAYRIPFAIQWVWPIPLFIVLYFAPDSPWWLVRTGQIEKAEKSVARLAFSETTESIKNTVQEMIHTTQLEDEMASGSSYIDCFKGTNLRRTEIVCGTFITQTSCGLVLGSPTYFLEMAGVPTTASFKLAVGGLGLGCVGTILSWGLLQKFGRRTLYVWGLVILGIILYIVGFLALASETSTYAYAEGGLVLLWLFCFDLTVGPVCYSIVSETSSTHLRAKSVSLARNAYYVASIIIGIIQPYLINPSELNWKGKSGIFWGGVCTLCILWAYFRIPEIRNRTYEELDVLFANKIPTRQFTRYKVDLYAEDPEQILIKFK